MEAKKTYKSFNTPIQLPPPPSSVPFPQQQASPISMSPPPHHGKKYAKTLRLTSDQLVCLSSFVFVFVFRSSYQTLFFFLSLSLSLNFIYIKQKTLNLNKGANSITFSLSATGQVACTARIFMWDHTDQVVVSDIDGTITK